MFQIENKHYQELLEKSKRGRYAKRNRKALQDFAEVVENLEPFEVGFIKALRACDWGFKAEIKSAVLSFHQTRFKFYRLLSIMLTAESCLKDIPEPARGFPTEPPEEGGTGETPRTQTESKT